MPTERRSNLGLQVCETVIGLKEGVPEVLKEMEC
jgi:hypothetical protein